MKAASNLAEFSKENYSPEEGSFANNDNDICFNPSLSSDLIVIYYTNFGQTEYACWDASGEENVGFRKGYPFQ